MRPRDLIQILPSRIKRRKPILITGRPGIGKTEIIISACFIAGCKLLICHPVTSDPTDYKGLGFAIDTTKADFLPYGDLYEMIHATEPLVVFFDDIGQAPPSVQAALMQLILGRCVNGHKISDFVTFVAATNRREDKADVRGFIEPLKSRFDIIQLDVHPADWEQWALAKPDFPLELIAATRMCPEWLTQWEPSKNIENSPNPRNMAEVAEMINDPDIPAHCRLEMFASRMGMAEATKLEGFLRMYNELPKLEEIVLNPATAPISDNPSCRWLVMTSLAKKAKPENFDPIVKYAERFEKDFQVLFMKNINDNNKSLMETRTFIQWSADNEGIF